jgi:hypothetical protein
MLVAQVTFAKPFTSDVKRKIDRLQHYRNGKQVHLIFFCDCAQKTIDGGITIFPLPDAYRIFTATPSGKTWLANATLLDRALGSP